MPSRRVSKSLVIAIAVGTSLVGSAQIAEAVGRCVPQSRQVVFYYDGGSGNCDSNDFSGYGTARLRSDAPGCCNPASNRSYTAYYYRNRTLQPDDILKYHTRYYDASEALSTSFTTSSGSRYHTNVIWDAIEQNQAGDPNGFSRAS